MRLFLFILIVSACSTEEYTKDCSYIIDGLCVINSQISPEGISFVVGAVQEEFSKKFSGLDLPTLMEGNSLSLNYIDSISGGSAGAYWPEWKAIEIQNREGEYNTCEANLIVLQHEMLHFVSREFLGVAGHDSRIFLLGAGTAKADTIEKGIHLNINKWCANKENSNGP